MPSEQPYTGLQLEAHIKRLLDEAPPGKPYCVLCLAEAFGITSVTASGEIASALRRIGTYQPDRYEAVPGKCVTHSGQRDAGTFWMISPR